MSKAPAPMTVALDVVPLAGTPTGVGEFCGALVRELTRRRDVEVRGYAVSSHPKEAGRCLPAGVRLRGVPIPSRLANRLWSLGSFPTTAMVAGTVDVVHGTNFVVPPSNRVATIVTIHDMTAWRFPELCTSSTLRYPGLLRRALEHGAMVHAPSRFTAGELVELAGADPARIRVIPNAPAAVPVPGQGDVPGEPSDEATEPSDEAGEPDDVPPFPFVLALGTIEPRKDYPTLVRAFDALAPDHPTLRLVIAGAKGWGADAFARAVRASAVADRVVVLGYVNRETRARLLGSASVLAYPSVYEGFGMTPLEAMAAGVPVVTTAGGAIPEVVGGGAIVVPVRDHGSFAAGLATALYDEAERRRLIAKGREQAAMYSWEESAEQMVGLYREAIELHA